MRLSGQRRDLSFLARVTMVCALLFAALASAEARPDGFFIREAETVLERDLYRLNADIDFHFSTEALEALSNGVPLTVRLDVEVQRQREYLWNETVASLAQKYALEYHALTEQYLLKNINSGEQQSFRSLRLATDTMGSIKGLPMLDRDLLDPNSVYRVRMRASLDIESLPAPLRPWAWFSSDWRLSSKWHTWSLTL